MTATLTAWLLAQIAAEEERARAERVWRDEWYREYGGRAAIAVTEWDIANDPAATLRRCAAYRAIMEIHTPRPRTVLGDTWDECSVCFDPDTAAGDYDFEGWPCGTLRALASIYADADGYDPSWRLG